ncbi:MAG: hypothetical protein NTV43_14925 [Methylococcales bacterium]|nr:hypothetical protein [Methylococcales bacterium]
MRLVLGWCLGFTPVFAASFNYLYIEASEGNSSGGHSAIQFGDEIYHYQHHDSGLIRLLRQDKAEFHFTYRFLQNRRIHLATVEVSDETFKRLSAYFKLQFLAQEQQFKQLDALQKDRLLLRSLLYRLQSDEAFLDADFSSVLRLDGVGLFYEGQLVGKQALPPLSKEQLQASKIILSLREKIAAQYGNGYLLNRRKQITADIKAQKPSPRPMLKPLLSSDNFPPAMAAFAESYADNLTALAALDVLENARPVLPDALLLTAKPVNPQEQAVLTQLRGQMLSSLLASINSGRPDWGYALLVNIARYIAVELTLQQGHWLFVDDFSEVSEWLSAEQFAAYAPQMQTQIKDAKAQMDLSLSALLKPGGLTETSYSQLEMSANHYYELLKGLQHQPVRFIGEKALPTKSVGFPDWQLPQLTVPQLTAALAGLERYATQLQNELEAHYQYDLLTRNCVTELFNSINLALAQGDNSGPEQLPSEASSRLGGDIFATYNFIPFVAFQSVQDHYKVTDSRVLNSYRGLQLERLYAQDGAWLLGLRESNTFSSRLYRYNPDDAFFVFFTDDALALRPVYGAFNTVAGMGQSVLGLLSWPFDGGKNLKSGATGVLMSLPELVFVNMRKGSYKYLSYPQFVRDENAQISQASPL